MGIYGNEIADDLVRECAVRGFNLNLSLKPDTTPEKDLNLGFSKVSFATLERRIREQLLVEWKNKWETGKKKHGTSFEKVVGNIPRFSTKASKFITPKSVSASLFQLKVGHGYFKSYTKRLNREYNGLCSCGQLQTPSYLILACSRYKEERQALQKVIGSTLTLPKLLNVESGHKAFTVFLL